ncbi:Bestrophin, RFP-TM, chloride channel-domain-containing protein [Entophlyctis helioformis]|nr:Bestrophin, RFP-TM, chloride channel-domain-containing protein [Entophlyctis helioformis]
MSAVAVPAVATDADASISVSIDETLATTSFSIDRPVPVPAPKTPASAVEAAAPPADTAPAFDGFVELERTNSNASSLFQTPTQTVSNSHSYASTSGQLFSYKSSVIPKIMIPVAVMTVWGAVWTVVYIVGGWKWVGIPPQLIGILAVVMGLLLVFRTNTAYDRFWEARRLWGTMVTHVRTLARLIWVSANINEPKAIDLRFNILRATPANATPLKPTPEEAEEVRLLLLTELHAALNLVMSFPVAVKHHLRGEKTHKFKDLHNLLIHLPDYRVGAMHPNVDNMPVEISLHLSGYNAFLRRAEMIDTNTFSVIINTISNMVDVLSNYERIRSSPIPKPYAVHLKQTLTLYLLSLPMQLVMSMGWSTIPVVFLAAFTLLGIEAIGGEIENPFGYDRNDLNLDGFCEDLKKEITQMIARPQDFSPTRWSRPVQMGDFSKLFHLSGKPKGRQPSAAKLDHAKAE